MKTLAEIFTHRFLKKTKSTLTDNDIQTVIDLYTKDLVKKEEIAAMFNAHTRLIRRILVACVDKGTLKAARSRIKSLSVNDPERKAQTTASWRKNNPDWKSPMLERQTVEKMLETRSKNTTYQPAKNFGDSKGKNNGRYYEVDASVVDSIKDALNKKLSIPTIVYITKLSKEKVLGLIKEHDIMSDKEVRSYRRRSRSLPEYLFGIMLENAGIKFEIQHKIYYHQNDNRRKKLYDFYFPTKNLLIELDGKAWHDVDYCRKKKLSEKHIQKVIGNVENDRIKTLLAADSGYTLIRTSDFSTENFLKMIETLSV